MNRFKILLICIVYLSVKSLPQKWNRQQDHEHHGQSVRKIKVNKQLIKFQSTDSNITVAKTVSVGTTVAVMVVAARAKRVLRAGENAVAEAKRVKTATEYMMGISL